MGRAPTLADARLFARVTGTTEEHELRLSSFNVNVAASPTATRTHLDLQLQNPNTWQAEGVLRIPIPPAAAITRAVLHVNGRPMEGAFVARERAREIYRSITAKRRDPALVVWSGPEWVDVSIFPFAPQETRRFELEWTEPTAYVDHQAWYRIPVLSQRGRSTFLPGSLKVDGHTALGSKEGWWPLKLAPPPLLTASHAAGEPFGFVLSASATPVSSPPAGVYVVAETSFAMSPYDRSMQRAALERLLTSSPPEARFSIAAVDWAFQELSVSGQPLSPAELLKRLDSIPSAGALDLRGALLQACQRATAQHARTVVFIGKGEHAFRGDPLEAPLECFREAGASLLAIGTGGPVPASLADAASLTGGSALSSESSDDTLSLVLALRRHLPLPLLEGRVEGWRPLLTVTGEVRWAARYLGDPPADAVASARPVLEALWARSLPLDPGSPASATSPAVRPVLSPLTSLLVLETEADYQRFDIPVPQPDPEALGVLLRDSMADQGQPPVLSKSSGAPDDRAVRKSSDAPDDRAVRVLMKSLSAGQKDEQKLAERILRPKQEAMRRGYESQMGKSEAPRRIAHAAPKVAPNNEAQARIIANVFGAGGLGGELKSAMGNTFGAAPGDAMGNTFGAAQGDAQGFGGLGLRGLGSGGGGGVGDTIGLGGIDTRGRGGGASDSRIGISALRNMTTVDLGVTSAEPMVQGSLDKELIRKVIHGNRGQIRYCYEIQLLSFPKLRGKVSVKFLISPSGAVAQSQVSSSSAGNAELEACVAGRVRTWVFPKPRGGGVVIVTYPFIFRMTDEASETFAGDFFGPLAPTLWQQALGLLARQPGGADRTSAVAKLLGAPTRLGPAALGWWLRLQHRAPGGSLEWSDVDRLHLTASLLHAGEDSINARRVLSEGAPRELERIRVVLLGWGFSEDAKRLEELHPGLAPLN